MDYTNCVARRTRSKSHSPWLRSFREEAKPNFEFLGEEKIESLSGSTSSLSGKRKNNRLKGKRVAETEPGFVFLGRNDEVGCDDFFSVSNKRMRKGMYEEPKPVEVIDIDDNVNKMGFKDHCEKKGFEDAVDVDVDEEDQNEWGEGSNVGCGFGKMSSFSGSASSPFISKEGQRNSLKRKRVVEREPDLVFLGEYEEGRGFSSSAGSKCMKRMFEAEPERVEVIDIDDSADEKGFEHCEKKRLKHTIDVDDNVSADKVGNFGNVGCGSGPENCVPFDLDQVSDSEEEDGVSESVSEFDTDYISSSTENDESSDEDFRVDGDREISSSEDDSTSDDDDDKKESGRYSKRSHRKMSVQKESVDSARESEKKRGDNKDCEINDANSNECLNVDTQPPACGQEDWNEGDRGSNVCAEKGENDCVLGPENCVINNLVDDSNSKEEDAVNESSSGFDCDYTSPATENDEAGGEDFQVIDEMEISGSKDGGDEKEGGRYSKKGHQNVSLEKETMDSDMTFKIGENEKKIEDKQETEESVKNDANANDSLKIDTQPPACGQGGLPWKCLWEKAEEPVEKSEAEEELNMLWEEMECELKLGEIDSLVCNGGVDEEEQSRGSPTNLSMVDRYLDKRKVHPNKGTGVISASTLMKNQEKIGDSAKIFQRKESEKVGNGGTNEAEQSRGSPTNLSKVDRYLDKRKEHPNKGTGVISASTLMKNQEKIGDSAKIFQRKESEKVGNGGTNEAEQSRGKPTNRCEHDDKYLDKGKERPNKGTGVKSASTLMKNQEKIGDSAKIFQRKESEKVGNGGTNEVEQSRGKPTNRCEHDDKYLDKGKERPNKGTGVKSASTSMKNQEKIGDQANIFRRKESEKERRDSSESEKNNANANATECVNTAGDNKGCQNVDSHKVQRMPSRPKEIHLIELLSECFGMKHNSVKDYSNRLRVKDDDVHWRDTQPPACGHGGLPLKCFWDKAEEPVEKSKEEELDMLWEELDFVLRSEEIDSKGNSETDNAEPTRGSPASLCKHDIILDDEVGLICRLCLWISLDIKNIFPSFADDNEFLRSRKRTSLDGVNDSLFDGPKFDVSAGDKEAVWSHKEGTVWDLIPDIKKCFYPHQQEGLEFIWTNLAGTIDLQKLKNADPCSAGGCIISHAPGTGKTRLTIVFLQTYLELFPQCRPIIIAPASLLLTWEDEFRKWNVGIPFHNLNSLELSGKEHVDATRKVDLNRNSKPNNSSIRMVKLYSWFIQNSILGISYNLYEKLAGAESKADVKTGRQKRKIEKEMKHSSMKKKDTENKVIGKFLREIPDLLVLDEGHTPRNQSSCIWRVLSEIQTQKRIILSGTPFQNTFLELYNTLCLAKPTFPDTIPPELKKFCQSRLIQEKKAPKDLSWEAVSSGNTTRDPADERINQLKLLMDPFVHVHKGSILQKNLLGLKECVVTLKPENLQKEILQSIECSQNTFGFDHKLALVSIHPSLFLRCPLSEKEEAVVDRRQLEELELSPYEGVKTRFLVEFVRLCDALNEKVLVFSEFIDPLCMVIKQLESIFDWSEGKEVLYMHGKLSQKQRQSLIHSFNDSNSKAKILLASSNACSEGINLTGASRVVLLNVLWNPSKERQAISRAYRIGQKRVVYTYHLITQESWAKYCKSQKKDWYSEKVFSDKITRIDPRGSSSVVLEDKVLDQMVHHDKLKDMFGDCFIPGKERDFVET